MVLIKTIDVTLDTIQKALDTKIGKSKLWINLIA